MNSRIQIIVANEPVYNDHYIILADDKSINIIFTKSDTAYDVSFSDQIKHKDTITLDGGERNEVVIVKAEFSCEKFKINANAIIIEEHVKLQLHHADLTTSQFQLYGRIEAHFAKINILIDQPGFINKGVLIIHDTLNQRNGDFINDGKVDAKNFTIQYGTLVENSQSGEWNVWQNQSIQAMTFVNNGFHYAKVSHLHCMRITLDGITGSHDASFRADDNLIFKDSSKCTFYKMFAVASRYMRVAGYFYKSKRLEFIGSKLHVCTGAVFNKCDLVKVFSNKTLKVGEGVRFVSVKHFMADSMILFINSKVTATRSVKLAGRQKLLVTIGAGVVTQRITLAGRVMYIYGVLSGSIDFLNKVHLLYLAEKSLVTSCKRFAVKCDHVYALGAINAEVNSLRAIATVQTSASTYINSIINKLRGVFVTVDGTQIAKTHEFTANALLELKAGLGLDGQELSGTAAKIEMDGRLLANVKMKGIFINNRAAIQNNGTTILDAKVVLNNAKEAVIDSADTTVTGDSIQHHGYTKGKEARFKGKEVYLGKDATQNHDVSKIEGIDIGVAGKSDNAYTQMQASKTIKTYKSGDFNGGVFSAQANVTYEGDANINMDEVSIVTGEVLNSTSESIKSTNGITLSSKRIFTDSKQVAQTIKVIKQNDHNDTRIQSGKNSSINAASMQVTVDQCVLSGSAKVNNLSVMNDGSFKTLSGSHVKVSNSFQIKTKDCRFGGSMSQQAIHENSDLRNQSQATKAEDNTVSYVEAQSLRFAESSVTTSDKPVITSARETSLSGVHSEKSLLVKTNKGILTGNLQVTDDVDLFHIEGAGENPSVSIETDSVVESKKVIVENCDLSIAGKVASADILFNRLKTLEILPSGMVGTMHSNVAIHAEHMRHYGLVEGRTVNIKCSQTFMMLFNGKQARIKARKLNISTLFYLDVLGLTEAQQSNLSSLLALSAGIRMVNFDVKNNAFDFEILPTMTHLTMLTSIIDDIKNGNITITKSDYAIYSAQTLLAGLRMLLPKITMVASLGLSIFFICRNLINLVQMLKKLNVKELQAVDLLPMLITVKNIGLTAANGASSVESMYADLRKLGLPAFLEKLGSDIEGELANINVPSVSLDSVADAFIEPVIVAAKDIISIAESGMAKAENLIPGLKKAGLSESFKKIESRIDADIASIKKENPRLDNILTGVVMPVASVFMPSSYNHSLAGVSLFSPVVSFTNNHTSVLNISVFSPSIAAITSSTGYGFLADIGSNFTISESLTGYSVFKYGNQTPHAFQVSANTFSLVGDSSVVACDVNLDISKLTPENVKALNNLTIKYDTAENENDLLELKGKWGIFLTDKDKPVLHANDQPSGLNHRSSKQSNKSAKVSTNFDSVADIHANVVKIVNSTKDDTDINQHKLENGVKNHRGVTLQDNLEPKQSRQDAWYRGNERSNYGKKHHQVTDQQEPFSSTLKVSIETNHPLTFSHDVTLPWSMTYKAPDLTVAHMTKLISHGGKLALVSTNGTLEMDGELDADIVYEISSDIINQKFGKTSSIYLYVLALGDINFDQSHNESHNGVVQSYGGNIIATAAQVIYRHFGVIQAYDTITAKCISRSSPSMTDFMTINNDKTYLPTVFKGGDGKDHNGVGLVIKSDTTINDASTFTADGDVYVDAHHNLILREQHNATVDVDEDTSWYGETTTTVTYSVHVQHPTIQSVNGNVYMNMTKGTIDSVAGVFLAAKSVFLHTNDGPIFRDIVIKTITKETDSWLGIIQLSSDENIVTELMGQVFVSPESLQIRTEYGDIVIPNTDIRTGLLVTDAPNGNTVIYQTPIDHVEILQYLTLSLHLGPINFSYSFNPKDAKPLKIWASDSLLNAADAMSGSSYKGESVAGTSNLVDAVIGKVNAYHDKKPLIDLSIGSEVSNTSTIIHETIPGKHSLQVNTFINHGKGLTIVDTPTAIGTLQMDDGGTFTAKGGYYNQMISSSTASFGMSYDFLTKKLDVNAAYSRSYSNSHTAVPCIINIDKLHFRNQMIFNLDNSQLKINHVDGDEIKQVNLQSQYSDSQQHMDSYSLGSNLSFGVSHKTTDSHAVVAPAKLEINDIGKTKIDEINSNGGILKGDAIKQSQALVHQTDMTGTHRESGFSIASNGGGVISSVGLNNTVDTSVNGSVAEQQGTRFNFNIPTQTINLLAAQMHHNQPQNTNASAAEVEDIPTRKPVTVKKHEKVSPQAKDANNPICINQGFVQHYLYPYSVASTYNQLNDRLIQTDKSEDKEHQTDNQQNQFSINANFQNKYVYPDITRQLCFPASLADFPQLTDDQWNPETTNKSITIFPESTFYYNDSTYMYRKDNEDQFLPHVPKPYEGAEIFIPYIDSQKEVIVTYRGSASSPESVFSTGFKARGSNYDVLSHARGAINQASPDSGFVSTSLSLEKAARFPINFNPGIHGGYVYQLVFVRFNTKYVDVDSFLSENYPNSPVSTFKEKEIAIRDVVDPSSIRGAYENSIFALGNHRRIAVPNTNEMIVNLGFKLDTSFTESMLSSVKYAGMIGTSLLFARDVYSIYEAVKEDPKEGVFTAASVRVGWLGAEAGANVAIGSIATGTLATTLIEVGIVTAIATTYYEDSRYVTNVALDILDNPSAYTSQFNARSATDLAHFAIENATQNLTASRAAFFSASNNTLNAAIPGVDIVKIYDATKDLQQLAKPASEFSKTVLMAVPRSIFETSLGFFPVGNVAEELKKSRLFYHP